MTNPGKLPFVGPAPHWRTGYSLTKMHYAWLLALCPALIAAVLAAPLGAGLAGTAGLLALAGGTGILGEYFAQVIFRQPYYATKGHGLLIGLLVAMLLPPTLPWWVLVMGVLLAVVVGKQLFGGLGAYPFHPAMVGVLVLYVSYPHHVFPVGGITLAAASPLVIYLTAGGGLLLALLGHIRFEVPLAVLAGVALGALALGGYSPDLGGPLDEILTGHVILTAFFIAPDPTSSPANRWPLVVYGLGVGFLAVLIRVFGIWPDALPFAVMLMNVCTPLLDRVHPKPKEVVVRHG
jgi:Na+-translocating ferredoxin:NAD+ oxidoreductase subunit D